MAHHGSGQRPCDGTGRIGVASTIQDCRQCACEISEVTEPGVDGNWHRVIDVARNAPLQSEAAGKIADCNALIVCLRHGTHEMEPLLVFRSWSDVAYSLRNAVNGLTRDYLDTDSTGQLPAVRTANKMLPVLPTIGARWEF